MSKNIVEQMVRGIVCEVLGKEAGVELLDKLAEKGDYFGELNNWSPEKDESLEVACLEKESPILLSMKLAGGMLSSHCRTNVENMRIGELARAFMVFDPLTQAAWSGFRLRHGLKGVGVGIRLEDGDHVSLVSFPSKTNERELP